MASFTEASVRVNLELTRYADDSGRDIDRAIVRATSYTAEGRVIRSDTEALDPIPASVKNLLDTAETRVKQRWNIP